MINELLKILSQLFFAKPQDDDIHQVKVLKAIGKKFLDLAQNHSESCFKHVLLTKVSVVTERLVERAKEQVGDDNRTSQIQTKIKSLLDGLQFWQNNRFNKCQCVGGSILRNKPYRQGCKLFMELFNTFDHDRPGMSFLSGLMQVIHDASGSYWIDAKSKHMTKSNASKRERELKQWMKFLTQGAETTNNTNT